MSKEINGVLATMMEHRSYRKYLDKEVTDENVETVVSASQAAPSWINGQHVTIVVVRDKERRKKLATLSGGQKHIEDAPVFLVFCADFHRINLACEIEEKVFESIQNIDTVIVGATDVGISLGNAINAAESMGLGTVPIGGIRRNPIEVIELLQLPKYVIPISGLCIGHPDGEPGLKPRLPKNAIMHNEVYNSDTSALIHQYNDTYSNYLNERTNGKDNSNWTQRMAEFYSEPFYRNNSYSNVRDMLIQQGFPIKEIYN
ncbi:NADPH-dependent oxidoreductase [Psychrobacillus sp. OK032]|uniref:NADPH-dependent oxidoreductase n=1 Tax=Psychrobacillus sp. OK032 TaxID=1884358 RepID=UPI0008C0FB9C|nr:NADPH-dependent oxidoreductase [Psychrobacillus sp. OK032]SER69786.1 FMN reductase [NAD(P)H] [Psychrobacillus sp. OK032]